MTPRFDIPCRTAFFAGIALAGACLLGGCGPSRSAKETSTAESKTKAASGAQASTKRYPLTGKVVSIDKATGTINVDGDEIPGFMAAMTMPYQVKDAGILDKMAPGDRIKAEIVAGSNGAYLENISPVQTAASPKPMK